MAESVFTFKEDDWVVPELRDFFSTEQTRKKIVEVGARYQLSAPQTEKLFHGVRQVVRGRVSEDDLAQWLADEAGIVFDTALEIQGDFFVELFSDVEGLLGEQVVIYKDFHPEEFLPPQPPEVDLTEDIAKEAIKKSGILPPDPVLARRLITIVASCLKDVRDEAETKAVLEKPTKTGGMGLAPEKSAALLLLLAEAKPKVQAAKETAAQQEKARTEQQRALQEQKEKKFRELAARFGKAAPAAAAETLAVPKEKKEDLALESESAKEKAEIKDIAAKAVKKETFEDTVRVSAPLDAAVDEAVAASGAAPADEDLKRRFRLLVSLYFRDLRDGLETKSKFTMPVASGGMGVSDAEADRVMAALKAKAAAFHAGAYDRKVEEKAKYVEERQARVMNEQGEGERQEQDELERAYADLLRRGGARASGRPPFAPTGGEQAEPRVIPVVAAGGTPVAVVIPKLPPAAPPPAPPSASVREPRGTVPEGTVPIAATFSAAPANLPLAPLSPPPNAGPPVAEKPSATSPPSAPTGGQPMVSDVKFTPRLTGPVEELRQLALKDFRRLSKDPREATLKIKDKIDLLDDLGFEIKTQGIKAWQDSEISKLYLSILRRSLEGRPVVEVISELEKKGEPFLNKPEFDSITELNRKLRFG